MKYVFGITKKKELQKKISTPIDSLPITAYTDSC